MRQPAMAWGRGGVVAGLLACGVSGAYAAEWSADVGNKTVYTDNVFEFSAARRLALSEDPSQPTIVPVNRPSDVVWEPFVDVTRTFDHGGSKTEVSAKAQGFLFTNNAVFNHGMYRVQAKHLFSPDTSVLVRYRYTPDLFLGPNVERRSGLRLQDEERVTSHVWRVQVEQRMSEAWRGTLIGRVGLRQYNAAFAERDTTFWTLGPQFTYHGWSRVGLTIGYLYERGVADGQDEVQYKDDISYHQHVAVAGATVVLTERLSLDLGYFYRRKLFTSDIAGDANTGVRDTIHQGSFEFAYRLSSAWRATAEFQRTQRDSNRSQRGFFSDNVSIGLDYRF